MLTIKKLIPMKLLAICTADTTVNIK